MKVHVPGPLRSYTGQRSLVEAAGATLAEVLADLERQFPGIRFRMIDEQGGVRRHIKLFVNQSLTADLAAGVKPEDQVHIICAISGGV